MHETVLDRRRFVALLGLAYAASFHGLVRPLHAASGLRLAVIGVPTNSAGKPGGVAKAPMALRKAGLIAALRAFSDVEDFGDVAFEPHTTKRDPVSGLISPMSTVSMIYAVRDAVGKAQTENRFPLVLGGDCPVLLGALACYRGTAGRVGLAFVDGHEDAYGPHQSPTGEAADMELGLALGLQVHALPQKLTRLLPLVRPSDVVILGARDAKAIREDGASSLAGKIKLHDDNRVRGGPPDVMGRSVLSELTSRTASVWLHVDLDVLSTHSLSAVDYPQPGGLTWEELESLTRMFLSSPAVRGWDVTIYNPDLDPDGKQAARIVRFISHVLSARLIN